MRYVQLGKTGLKVSEVCLGTMTFGNEADEMMSRALMGKAFDLGINFFDSAHNYNKGATEEIVGRWIPPHRNEIILTSKVYFPSGGGMNDQGLSRRNLIQSVEKSLKRFQTDYIDILYLHHWDDTTDITQSLHAVNTLIEQGKVIYCAVSNFSAWQTMKAIAVSAAHQLAPIVAVQPMYSLLKRQVEVEILPMAAEEKLAVIPYNAIGAGMLTGKYLKDEKTSGRLNEVEMYRQRYEADAYKAITRRFITYAHENAYSPAALAVAWVKSHPVVTCPIIGARNLEQLNDSLGCLEIGLSKEQRDEISALSISPPTATDREPMTAMLARGW